MSIDFGKNQATADALDAYLALEKPQFAALINSKWGSGKTWFARKYLEHAKKGVQDQASPNGEQPYDAPAFCYVSLFDIIDNKEIDAAIMAQMNPVLFSKGGKFAGRITRFALEKVSSFLPIGVTPDDIAKCTGFIKELCCRRPKNLVVVLDDLERAHLPAELVLGYISDLLEEADAKVILLCNEAEMLEQNKEGFFKFREKVVGITLSVVPDIDSVFCASIECVEDKDFKYFFDSKKEQIIRIFNISETQNLRHIRRIAWEFSRIFHILPDVAKKNELYLEELLKYICVFSIEINSRNLELSEFDILQDDSWTIYKKLKNSVLCDTIKKYNLKLWDIPISPLVIKKFFYEGILLQENIRSSYNISKYNQDEKNTPIPLKLWHFFDMEDSEVISLYKKMQQDIANHIYKSPGIILHAFSISLFMSDIGIEKKDKQTIVKCAKKYIMNINIEIGEKDIDIFEYLTYSYASLGFHNKDSEEFKEIFALVKEISEDIQNKEKNEEIISNYQYLPESINLFLEKFPFDYGKYTEKDFIFTNIDINDFAKRISKLQQPDIKKVMTHILNVIQHHYQSRTEKNLADWVHNFCTALEDVSKEMPPLAGYRLKLFVNDLCNLLV